MVYTSTQHILSLAALKRSPATSHGAVRAISQRSLFFTEFQALKCKSRSLVFGSPLRRIITPAISCKCQEKFRWPSKTKTTMRHPMPRSPVSAAVGSDVFSQCSCRGADGKVMAGAPPLTPLVRGGGNPHGRGSRRMRLGHGTLPVASLKGDAFPSIFVSGTLPSRLLGERWQVKVKIQPI